MPKNYDPRAVEAKWRKKWEDGKVYSVDLKKAKDPFYTHVMWPYPSGDKLHVGHWYNFGPADTFARFMRMQGKDVFSPMGFDAFGLPAENYAIKTGVHPDTSTRKNVQTMIEQLRRMGCMYDWDKMANSSDPEYYQWTQWLFLKMYEHGLAYQKDGLVNWCPSCQTVLANEQVKEGTCERCETVVIQKPLKQWYWKTTQYADRLLAGLDTIEWPEKTKTMQRNWIGRKEGINITYEVEGTTRGLLGPMNWPMQSSALAGDSKSPLTADSKSSLTADLNRRLTDEWKRRIHSPRTCHIVFPTYTRFPVFKDPLRARRVLSILENVAERHGILIHEGCAMPDHIHLLLSFESDRHMERDVIKKIKGASAREFLKLDHGKNDHLWASGMHFEEVRNMEQFSATIQYIRGNPKKEGISEEGRLLSTLPETITVFTTRPDTNFGATFLVLAPEHPFVKKVIDEEIIPPDGSQAAQVKKYYMYAMAKTELERQEEGTKKTGAFTGFYAVNQLTSKRMPVWVSDFVLGGFGTGAVVGVPGHDVRDFEFAKEYGIEVIRVVVSSDGDASPIERIDQVQEEEGTMINSGFLNGMPILDATQKIMDYMEEKGWGKRVTTYRLRDWLISRQRYWGAPIPIVYDPEGKPHPIPEKHLPWLLPTDVSFNPKGKSPLTESKEFIERTKKIFGKGWRPEYDTMDTFVCSSYYSFMYLGASHEGGVYRQRELKTDAPADPKLEKKWMPVSMYIGGPEHATGHLIYARFVSMALKDFGIVQHEEPYQRLVHQGLITHKGAKMSKSKGNVVSPDAFVDRYGADVFRMYLMFMGPFTEGGDWSDLGIKGIDRFVQRAWDVLTTRVAKSAKEDMEFQSLLHRTIKRVTDSIASFHFNTALSALMEFLNAAEALPAISPDTAKTFTLLLAPLAPHLTEELWEQLGGKDFVINQIWPLYEENLLKSASMTIAVQVNGKLRGTISIPSDMADADVIAAARAEENVKKFLTAKPKKELYVKGRLVSFVV